MSHLFFFYLKTGHKDFNLVTYSRNVDWLNLNQKIKKPKNQAKKASLQFREHFVLRSDWQMMSLICLLLFDSMLIYSPVCRELSSYALNSPRKTHQNNKRVPKKNGSKTKCTSITTLLLKFLEQYNQRQRITQYLLQPFPLLNSAPLLTDQTIVALSNRFHCYN